MKIIVTDTIMARRLDAFAAAVNAEVEWVYCQPDSPELLNQLNAAHVFVGSPFTSTMAQAAVSLKLIQLAGAGTEGIAFESLRPGIIVANTYHHERSIAEHVLMTMLALSRGLLRADRCLRQGQWRVVRSDTTIPVPQTLRGLTLGLIGFGHIGKQVVQVTSGLAVKVMAIKRRPEPELATEYGLTFMGGHDNLPELLAHSDFVVIAAPLTDETRDLIGTEQLQLMKPTAYLINVARGPIVNEIALFNALKEGRIAGAALDTWYRYPQDNDLTMPASLPFHELDNVIMTPHNSGETGETIERRAQDIVENIKRLLAGQPLHNVVYPQP